MSPTRSGPGVLTKVIGSRERTKRVGIALASLCYQDEPRMTAQHGTAIPLHPYRTEFEDALMRGLVDSGFDLVFDFQEKYSSQRVLAIYVRYRTLPDTLQEDENALVYASLCLALYVKMSTFVSSGSPRPESREDITYFRMAVDALNIWNRPSITAACGFSVQARLQLSDRRGLTLSDTVRPSAWIDVRNSSSLEHDCDANTNTRIAQS